MIDFWLWNLLRFVTAYSHECLFYFFLYTHTLFFSCYQLPSSLLLPVSPSGAVKKEHTRLCMKTSTWWLYSSRPKCITDFSIQMQAGHSNISNMNTQKWGLISWSDMASFRYEGKSPLCLVTIYSGPGTMSVLKPIWIQLGWSWGDRLHTLKHTTMVLYLIFQHTIQLGTLDLENNLKHLLCSQHPLIQRNEVQFIFNLNEYRKAMWISCFVLLKAFSHYEGKSLLLSGTRFTILIYN